MKTLHQAQFHPLTVLTALISGIVFASCGSIATQELSQTGGSAPQSAPSVMEGMADSSEYRNNYGATDAVVAQEVVAPPEMPRSQPQLAKMAELVLTVESVEDSLEAVSAIVQQQQGDILGLQNQIPVSESSRQTATLQLRVPQANLDPTLTALKDLGNLQRQSLTAEDVSNQLVDLQARLRNLRTTEENLLEIMERSGSVGDVLKVAQELSNVRNSIEQLDAQLKSLQNRVTYSTVTLTLQSAIATTIRDRSVQIQLQETWERATHSLGKVTVDLLQLGIWLMVYSPYWLLLAGIALFSYTHLRRQQIRPATPPDID